MSEVHVLAHITTKPGAREDVLAEFKQVMPLVHAEEGCIYYGPTIDTPDAGAVQTELGPDTFVVVEKWASLAHLQAHLKAPHMAEYGAKVKDLLADRVIHILSDA